jgi:hypothetical protein
VVVAPVLHFKVPVVHAVAVKVAFSVPQITAGPPEITGAAGFESFCIEIPDDDTLVPQSVVQVALYVPDSPTSKVVPVAPVLHVTVPVQPVAVNVAFSPSQHTVLFVVTVGAPGNGLTVIVIVADDNDNPHSVWHLTEYVPAPTSTIAVVAVTPVHINVPLQPAAVNVAFSVPHKAVLFEVNVGATGTGLVVITIELEFTDVPQLVVHVAVYVPAPTSLVVPVPPPDHVIVPVLQPVAVNVAFSVPQISVLFDVIAGADGTAPVVIDIEFEAGLAPQVFSHVAV